MLRSEVDVQSFSQASSDLRLKSFIDLSPALAAIANPIDVTTQFMNDAETIARYLQAFAEDKNFDFLILVLTLSASGKMALVAERIAALAPSLPKPMAVCWPVGGRFLASMSGRN